MTHPRGEPGPCDCGGTGVHYFGGWECAECLRKRKLMEHQTGYVVSVREIGERMGKSEARNRQDMV